MVLTLASWFTSGIYVAGPYRRWASFDGSLTTPLIFFLARVLLSSASLWYYCFASRNAFFVDTLEVETHCVSYWFLIAFLVATPEVNCSSSRFRSFSKRRKMATAVPSRFAVLSIEDDDYKPKKTQKNATTNKTNAKNKGDKSKQQQPNKKKQNKVWRPSLRFCFWLAGCQSDATSRREIATISNLRRSCHEFFFILGKKKENEQRWSAMGTVEAKGYDGKIWIFDQIM